ncbi:MAG: alpha-L-arabinofuranosidase C-terminal domain-containing protein [Prevotella sp.]
MNRLLLLLASVALSGNVFGQRSLPACQIMDTDTVCRIFVYSPGDKDGLHLAYLEETEKWVDAGQLCGSDYSRWGSEKRMYNPYVTHAADGTWRAVWALNDYAPCFAVAYSEDLVTWRPQDYPKVSVKGVQRPVVFQMDDGSFDIYLRSASGKRHVHASNDFRTFKESAEPSTIDDIAWITDTATVGQKRYEGNIFDVPKLHLDYMLSYFDALAADAEKSRVTMRDDKDRFQNLPATVSASLTVDMGNTKAISDKLVGIFFEDISYAADGGLYAELVQNRDFEYSSRDRKEWNALTAWEHSKGVRVETAQPLSKVNPHYVVMGADTLYNLGWDGIADKGADYDFSMYARMMADGAKQMTVALVADDGTVMAEGKLKVAGRDWQRYALSLSTATKKRAKLFAQEVQNCRLVIVGKKDAEVALDMISLFPHDTYKGHGLRKDLAETIAGLKPKFVRFPGGCMSHGDGIDNIYHWNHTVGPWQDRVPDKNIWHYHQTRGLGFYEYFQFCEDIGAEPLPVLAAGVPCQNSGPDKEGFGGQQGGIPMEDMPAYCQEILDMIEWANGDPAKSKWAKMRADAGHPEPFNLKYVGIGNEDIISTVFEERCLMICKAIKEKYPDIVVCGTVGPFHDPSADYIEGWRFAKENKQFIDMVDEHYYESPGWFLNHQDYYDNYDRTAPKVYLGEWASRTRTMESALVEAMHLCHIEKNADVVVMTSYAPLLCKEKHHNWNPDMIYFDNTNITLTPSYHTQKLFSVNSGDKYVASTLRVPEGLENRVAASVVADSKSGKKFLKLVNALPSQLRLGISGLNISANATVTGFRGMPADKAVQPAEDVEVEGSAILLPPYSVVCVAM